MPKAVVLTGYGPPDVLVWRDVALPEPGPGQVRINQAGCLDRCEEGPCIVVYPDAVWYGHVTVADEDPAACELEPALALESYVATLKSCGTRAPRSQSNRSVVMARKCV